MDNYERKVLSVMSMDEKNIRHRFTVPIADTKVNDWIKNQSNLGFSLRVLIKAFVKEYGYQDATCLELGTEVKRRGRPPKALKAQVDSIDAYDDEASYAYQEQAVAQPSVSYAAHPAAQSASAMMPASNQQAARIQLTQQPVSVQPVQTHVKPVSAQPVQTYVKPVSAQPVQTHPVSDEAPSKPFMAASVPGDDDLMNMMSGVTSSTPIPASNDTVSATADDDGFVDPESLF